MNISSELQNLKEPIDVAIAEFKKDTDVNQLINTLNRKLTLFTETLIAAVIQQMLGKKKFLAELKAIGAKNVHSAPQRTPLRLIYLLFKER